jgi:pyrroline-5-carboxylate reductase
MPIDLNGPLLLAGAGKMGAALLEGLLAQGLLPADVRVQEPYPTLDLIHFLNRHGIQPEPVIEALDRPPGVILAAVKPQVMDEVFPSLARLSGPETIVVSIAAGRSIASFERHLAPGRAVVRAMPNTPAQVGRGITACCANGATSERQRQITTHLMESVGEVVWLEDESLMDAVTAVSGSGPAYVFFLVECLAAAGREQGLADDLAQQLARATVSGAGELLHRSALSASTLRANVTSPGGTTAAALEVLMDDSGLSQLMRRAVDAAVRRSRELSQ